MNDKIKWILEQAMDARDRITNVIDLLEGLSAQGGEETTKAGKWIYHTYAFSDEIECPFCHKRWNNTINRTETFDYCPGCGAELS